MNTSRRNVGLYAGALEHAGLGESAYFLRKAKAYLAHAQTSLEGVDPLGHIKRSNKRIDVIIEQIGEALLEIEASERALVLHAEEQEENKKEDNE